ncbi:SIR2 family protein [Halomonas alkaliantarctica]|uniref:SIR2 family protein n=1 Tax=Halomonas alkaliantarctica TaxID=232346 RepID=A0ABY8LP96_9GAMM|nr:SIR2 family protein [Halomonas alkaliantarctica]WGI25218.1 SIR2 family protein [Halomonas alkaliantarctica]
MKTVILLGAGISRSAGGSKPLAQRPPLDADFFQIARAAERKGHKQVVGALSDLVGDYSHTLTASLEASAAYLYLKAIDSPSGSAYHKGFLNLLKLLTVVLAKTTNNVSTKPRSIYYRFLLSELKKLNKPEDLTIITFNYDLLAERTLDQIASKNGREIFSMPGCYRLNDISQFSHINGFSQFENIDKEHGGVSVLKLHGSMNWQSKHTSPEPNPSALFSPSRAIHVTNSPDIATSLSTKNKRRVYMKPIIVPPVSGKRNMMHNSMAGLWKVASEALQKADRVVVAGYSCPPLDLEARILLSENLRLNENKKLYLIDPNPESAAKFIEICGVDHATLYTSVKDWVRDAVT